MIAPTFNGIFPHNWTAEILPNRPMILPSRHFTYPTEVEEVERGALEVLIRQSNINPSSQPAKGDSPDGQSLDAQPFLATCALGFRDPAAPSGLWSMPHPDWLCALSGGYAYLINTVEPERFTMLPYRPVLAVHPLAAQALVLFLGHHSILAWGREGQAWESDRLSSEGITITSVEANHLYGLGWDLMTDSDLTFTLDLSTGLRM